MYINTSHYSHDVASPTLQHPKGMFLKGFSRLRKYSTICRKNNDSGENCRLGHLPKMPKVTIFCLSQESDAKRKDKNRYECQPAFLRSSGTYCFSFSLSLAEYWSVSNSRRLNRGHLCLC